MEGLFAVFSIFYSFWPLILLFGLGSLFQAGKPFGERLWRAVQEIFIVWVVWALFWAYLAWQGRQPVLLLPEALNRALFFGLGGVTGAITVTGW